MRITVIKGTKRRTFKSVDAARRWAGRARKVSVVVTG